MSENLSENFTPLLFTKDWNEEWKELQKERRQVDSAQYWDKRAKTFTTNDAPDSYTSQFLEKADIRGEDHVLDMGCGTGALSVPLGKQGHHVIAADFSQGMLDICQQKLNEAHITTVEQKLMSWEDNWAAFGVGAGSVDVALASRSIATADIKNSLLRLDAVARRRVCVTVTTGSSPRIDERVMTAIGIPNVFGRDAQYVFNILMNEGIKPQVSYIESTRVDTYDSLEDAYGVFSRMAAAQAPKMTEAALRDSLVLLRSWLEDHLQDNPTAGATDEKGTPQKALCLDKPRTNTWAFISWDK